MLLTLSHYIEFPKLGWRFPLDDTLAEFQVFGQDFAIKWYGLLIALGFLLAVVSALRRADEFGLNSDRLIDVTLLSTIMGFIGARLYYVLFSGNLDAYLDDPLSILQVWKGGLGIYGGIIFAFAFGALFCKLFKVSFLSMCDMAALGFLIGQAVGRWGNFFNQEAFGGNTDLPWGMTGDVIASGANGSGYDTFSPVHPTFLYESLWCILGFVLLHILSKRAYNFKGEIFCGYVIWYGAGRFFIESVRTDSLMLGTIKVSQLVAILAVLGGAVMALILRRRALSLPAVLVTESADEENTIDLPGADTSGGTVTETVYPAEQTSPETTDEEETNHGETD